MKAIYYQNNQTSLKDIDKPVPTTEFNVLIKVSLAGICKTDLYVSQGKVTSRDEVTLGHEFCGYVEESLTPEFQEGDFIVCNPVLDNNSMIGVDYNGAFAEYIIVPASQCFHFSPSFKKLAAYIEPIAASMSPFKSPAINNIHLQGAIIGNSRITQLTYKILSHHYCDITLITDPFSAPENYYDYIIETWADESAINQAVKLLKPGGELILKSRNPNRIPLDLYEIVKKEIIIKGLYYYDFKETVEFSLQNHPLFDDFLGDVYPLSDWQKAFALSENSQQKIFLEP